MRNRRIHLLSALAVGLLSLTVVGCNKGGDDSSSLPSEPVSSTRDSSTKKPSSSSVEESSIKRVEITGETDSVKVGESITLTATVTGDEKNRVTWSSDNPDIASVDQTGTVTGIAAGTATIRATAVLDEDVSGTFVVTVTEDEGSDTEGPDEGGDKPDTGGDGGDTTDPGEDGDGDGGDGGDGGDTTNPGGDGGETPDPGDGDGDGDKPDTGGDEKPDEPVITEVKITGENTVKVGESITLTAEVVGDDENQVTWSSKNSEIASVDETGKVTGVSAGTTNIIATSVLDTTKSASFAVTVTQDEEPDTGGETPDPGGDGGETTDPDEPDTGGDGDGGDGGDGQGGETPDPEPEPDPEPKPDPEPETHPDTVHEETGPSDLNIYFLSGSFNPRSNLWGWSTDNAGNLIKASGNQLVSVDGVEGSYRFVPFYFTLDHNYNVLTEWDGSGAGSLNLKSDLTNFFTGCLMRSDDGSNQTDDFDIDASKLSGKQDSEGNYNIFLWENYPTKNEEGGFTLSNSVFYSIDDFNAAYDAKAADSIHDASAPGNFNIYFYEENTLAREYRNYLYIYSSSSAINSVTFQSSGDENVTVDGIDHSHTFIPWYMNLDETYLATGGWGSVDNPTEENLTTAPAIDTTFTLNLESAMPSNLIFRSGNGKSQAPADGETEIILNTTQLKAETDGTYNIFVVETSGSWSRVVYYGIDAFNNYINSSGETA